MDSDQLVFLQKPADLNLHCFHAPIQSGWGTGVLDPLKNHKNIGFLSNIGPDIM